MLIAGFDLETTGFDGCMDHIVQYSFQIHNDLKCLLNETTFVNPGVPISNSDIHGIDDSQVVDAPDELRCLKSIDSLFARCYEHNIPVVVMNARFDITFYRNALLTHYGIAPNASYRLIDPLVIDRQFDKYRAGSRNLESLAITYGAGVSESHEFHDAEYDVEISIAVARKILDRWPWLSKNWDLLHRQQQKWSEIQTHSLYQYFISTGNDAYKTMTGGWPIETELLMLR